MSAPPHLDQLDASSVRPPKLSDPVLEIHDLSVD